MVNKKVQENNYDEDEPEFSDSDIDISDEELLADLLKDKPQETYGHDSVVVLDGLPIVDNVKLEKLKKVITKTFLSTYGVVRSEVYPIDEETNKTKGYAFIEYEKPSSAQKIAELGSYKLDKTHTLLVNVYSDFKKYENIPKNYNPETPQPYKDHGNLGYYLLEPNCYDEYSVIYHRGTGSGSTTVIYQNSIPEPTEIQKRETWTETYVRWSPRGSYLATFHGKGIALWGGPRFNQIQKFSHPGVQFIDFSPNEKYLVTFSPLVDHRSNDSHSLIIWDIVTGKKERGFSNIEKPVWPVFKWSHDDKYFARIQEDNILSVYETPTFFLLDKKSIKVQGIKDFSWSPTDNILAYWIAENKDVPAKVSLISIPSREVIRAKNLFNVAGCAMYWQKSGDHLCVRVERYGKAKREKSDIKYLGTYFNLEIFHMRERGIPVDSLEIKEIIQAFAWEPIGNKFAIICGESPTITATFYEVSRGQQPTELKKLDKRPWTTLFWSPQGRYIVLAGLHHMGALDFVDTEDFNIMASTEHFMATDVEWCPTGRYVMTSVSWWGHKVDNAYWLWSFQGKKIRTFPLDRFCQLQWRPRPPTILTNKEEIEKMVEKMTSQFELEDKMRLNKASKKLIMKRQQQMTSFLDYRKAMEEKYKEQKAQRLALRNEKDTDSGYDDYEEEIVEFLIKKDVVLE